MAILQEWLYPASIPEALEAQRLMASKVVKEDDFPSSFTHVGGMDVSNNLYDPLQMIYAAVVVLDSSSVEVVEKSSVAEKQDFPYVTGLLGFREAPALIRAFQALKKKPDVIFVDGHGISHPRGLGIASHLGVILDIPTIGVAKSILVGKPQRELGDEEGSQAPLLYKNEVVAMMYRSKKRSNPLIISTGHRVSLTSAVDLASNFLKKYKLPEPTRQAHLAANACRIQFKQINLNANIRGDEGDSHGD